MNYEFKEPCASCEYSSIYVGDEIHLDAKTLMPTIYCGHEEVCERLHNYQKQSNTLQKNQEFKFSPGPDEKLHKITFDSKLRAEEVVADLNKIMAVHDFVSVADVYRLVGAEICGDDHTVGWSGRVFAITRDVCDGDDRNIYRVCTIWSYETIDRR